MRQQIKKVNSLFASISKEIKTKSRNLTKGKTESATPLIAKNKAWIENTEGKEPFNPNKRFVFLIHQRQTNFLIRNS